MPFALSLALSGLVFSALWSSAFIAAKLAMAFCDPLSLLLARFAVAGLLMAGWVIATRGPATLVEREMLVWGAVLGLLNNALYLGLSFAGLATVSPALTVLIVSTAPFLTLGIVAALGARCSLVQVTGAVIGFGGVALVVSSRLSGGGATVSGILCIALGTLALSAGTVLYRRRATHLDPVALNAVQTLAGGLVLLPLAPVPLAAFTEPGFLLPFLHLVLAVSVAGILIWLHLVRRIGAAHAASVHLLNPVFGVVLSALVLGTPVSAADCLGALVVIAGLALITWDSLGRPSKSADLDRAGPGYAAPSSRNRIPP